jgi:hypothetical protein
LPVSPVEQDAEADHRPADHGDRTQRLDHAGIFQDRPGDDDRDRRDHKAKRQPDARRIHAPACQSAKADQPLRHVPPEENDDRDKRADMHSHVENQSLVPEVRQLRQQDQMAR